MRHTFYLIVVSGLLIGCPGGGSDGGGAPPIAAPVDTVVSGSVQAPGGQIAFFREKSLGEWFVSEAYAALTGLAPVLDGTIVRLERLDALGTSLTPITTTTTSSGRYTFNLTALGLQLANDLIIRVAGPGGKEMRAFVVGPTANLDPISEASVQVVQAKLVNGVTLASFTPQELNDIHAALALSVGLTQVPSGGTIQNAVNNVIARIDGNLQSLIDNAALPGQTSYGVGDIGNLFPLTQGNTWQYQGTRGVAFSNMVSRPGSTILNGVPALIYRESNPDNTGVPLETYLVKDATGITVYGNDDAQDKVTPFLVPYLNYRFPLGPSSFFPVVSNRRIVVDGVSIDLKVSVQAEDFEQVTVPAGTFNALKVTTSQVFTDPQTGDRIAIDSLTEWLTPGIGLIKSTELIQGDEFFESSTSQLIQFNVDGQSGGGNPIPPPPSPPLPTQIQISPPTGSGTAIFLNQSKQLVAITYDQTHIQIPGLTYAWQSTDPNVVEVDTTGRIVGKNPGQATITATASGLTSNALTFSVNNGKLLSLATNDLIYDPNSQKLFASIRTDSATNPDTVTIIDPATGNVGPFTPAGPQPNKLAVSGDGQTLFVGIDGSGAFRSINLPAFTTGSLNSLGNGTPIGCPSAPLLVDDMKVLPGLSQSVAISRKYSGGCSPWHFGVAVFDNGVQRQNSTQPFQPTGRLANIIQFSSSSNTLYGLDGESDGSLFTTITIDSSGASVVKETFRPFSTIAIRQDMVYDNGKIYTNDGEILDPVTHASLGKFERPSPDIALQSVRPDASLNRVFFIGRSFASGVLSLVSYDKNSLQLLGTEEIDLAVPAGAGSCSSGLSTRKELYRWSTDGVAFRTTDCHVVLLHSTLVQ